MKRVRLFVDAPSTGGSAIDREGNIYYSDPDRNRVLKITPDAKISMLVADARLLWPDAMWIDHEGFLWIPSAQIERTEPFNDGQSKVTQPVHIYKIQIGVKPSPIDHS